jgi:GT2 family glycosyltransferase
LARQPGCPHEYHRHLELTGDPEYMVNSAEARVTTSPPRVSVIVPLYNKGRYVRRAIESILGQNFGDLELIVVDDGSTDDSAHVVRTFQDQRLRLVQQSNSGEGAARNTGVHHSTCELIAFLDADDAWEPSFLADIVQMADEMPDCRIYATAFQFREPDGSLQRYNTSGILGLTDANGRLDYYACLARSVYPLSSSSICVRRSAFDACGLFDTGLRIGADVDMWVRILAKGMAAYSTRLGATYHRDATGRSTDQDRLAEKYARLLHKMILNLRTLDLSPGKRQCLTKYVASLLDLTVTSMAKTGRTLEAWRLAWHITRETSFRMGLRGASRTLRSAVKHAVKPA